MRRAAAFASCAPWLGRPGLHSSASLHAGNPDAAAAIDWPKIVAEIGPGAVLGSYAKIVTRGFRRSAVSSRPETPPPSDLRYLKATPLRHLKPDTRHLRRHSALRDQLSAFDPYPLKPQPMADSPNHLATSGKNACFAPTTWPLRGKTNGTGQKPIWSGQQFCSDRIRLRQNSPPAAMNSP
jgi:hypothetical protein